MTHHHNCPAATSVPPGLCTCGLDNPHKVPRAQWRKWNGPARATFNEIYALVKQNQGLFTHPKAAQVPDVHWNTTAWNVAFSAACAMHFRATAHSKAIEAVAKRIEAAREATMRASRT